ncbi:helix-turn-helix domain-containing protein [Rubellicoccus peritrichatus]|uniref:Helix-turn-helix domain-containing protein n=1 Tax=Rubellicoccus peritrichatus TaxID=3080537 RepID=A0AAQ3QVQ3_9BACT|nr:helix-turn-helix domain-containing protein [Puniceicoccus sp. CR14]WOO41145.1 helix-turn-helix domain-containing protein [Puniceicoccus sp. CR14]
MTKQSPSEPKRIALLIEASPSGLIEFASGMSEAILRHIKLDVVPVSGGPEAALKDIVTSGQFHGIIGSFVSDAWIRSLPSPFPLLNIEVFSRLRGVASVGVDWAEAGRFAAKSFQTEGIEQLAFAGTRGQYASQALLEGYAIDQKSKESEVSIVPAMAAAQKDWLKYLETPVGVLCSSPFTAVRLALMTKELGLAIAKDVAFIVVGDPVMASIQAGVEFSEIPVPYNEMGKAAAHLMELQLLDAVKHRELVPVDSVIVRASSLRRDKRHIAFERVIEAFPDRLGDNWSVEDMAKEAAMSRRAFEIRFRERFGASPHHKLKEIRLLHAQKLLTESSLSVGEIGNRCGYLEIHAFSAAFKRRFGMSPNAFRDRVSGE